MRPHAPNAPPYSQSSPMPPHAPPCASPCSQYTSMLPMYFPISLRTPSLTSSHSLNASSATSLGPPSFSAAPSSPSSSSATFPFLFLSFSASESFLLSNPLPILAPLPSSSFLPILPSSIPLSSTPPLAPSCP
ncbi:unnamed protein product [Closterium sp. Naga37s-1]|nr:unnamed protein product [Closterium sp. Naga37s-1]